MRADDGELWKVRGHVVEIGDRPGVLELVAHTAARARARAHHAGVEQDRQLALGAFLPYRVEALVVSMEQLAAGVDLTDALHAQLFVASLDLVHGALAKPGLDHAERDKHVRELLL